MTVKKLINKLDGNTCITFSTDENIRNIPLYSYPYFELKKIWKFKVKNIRVEFVSSINKSILYIEIKENYDGSESY